MAIVASFGRNARKRRNTRIASEKLFIFRKLSMCYIYGSQSGMNVLFTIARKPSKVKMSLLGMKQPSYSQKNEAYLKQFYNPPDEIPILYH